MHPAKFEHPRIIKVGNWAGTAYVCFLVLLVTVLFALRGWYGYSAGSLLIGGSALGWMIWKSGQMSEHVVVTDEEIQSRNYLGIRRTMRWDQVGELQRFQADRRAAVMDIVRLIARDGDQEIYFSDRIRGFDELMALVQAKAPHVRTGHQPTWWERLWY